MGERAKLDPSTGTCSFHIQQVLTTPYGNVSTLYYKRKLSSYNLTAFNEATKQGHCFVWSETMAKRGSSGNWLLPSAVICRHRTCQAFSPLFRLL